MGSKDDALNFNLMDMDENSPSSTDLQDPFVLGGPSGQGQGETTVLSASQSDPFASLSQLSPTNSPQKATKASADDENPFVAFSQPDLNLQSSSSNISVPPASLSVPTPSSSSAPLRPATFGSGGGGGGGAFGGPNTSTNTNTGGGVVDPFGASNEAEMSLMAEQEDGAGQSSFSEKEQKKDEKVVVTWNPLVVLKAYFDVDTDDIFARILQATAKGYAGEFTDFIRDKPDLYGPFWIASTLIVVSSVSGSFAQYISGQDKSDVDKVTASAFFFYGYISLLPLAIWGLLIYHKKPMRLLHLVCIYGYAMSVFIPAAILCTFPSTILRWSIIFSAAAISGLSIIMNVKQNFLEALQSKGTVYLAGIAAIHLGLAIGLKLYFFLY